MKDKALAVQKRAVIYLRVSTLEQTQTAKDDKGFSIHAQEAACTRKADELGATVIEHYTDRAESARSADRPQLQAMLARIRDERDVNYVIVYKLDRFSRNRIEDAIMLNELRTFGVQLISVTENIDNSPAGRMMHGVLASLAEYESANLAVRCEMGMHQKAKMGGTPGRAPVGYLNVVETTPSGHTHRTIASRS